MIELRGTAHAKLNLTLDVIGLRPDGYHDLEMVMQEISLGDQIILRLETGAPWQVITESGEIPCDDSNLAVKAARLFFAETNLDCGGLSVEIQKNTPVCAGMGGGSADGAETLRLLWEHYGRPISRESLFHLAEQVGSDVPFALHGGTALAREKGQVLSPLPPMPECHILLCKPDFPVSTPALFRAIDRETVEQRPDTPAMLNALENGDLPRVAALLKNVFEPLIRREHPELEEIRRVMLDHGALGASMTGSGPTMFAIYDREDRARSAAEELGRRWSRVYLTQPV